MTWRVRKSAPILPIPAIRADLVVLAIGVVLAIVDVPTRLSRLKRMTPAIHLNVANFDTAIGVSNVTARGSASVGFISLSLLVLYRTKSFGCLFEIPMN